MYVIEVKLLEVDVWDVKDVFIQSCHHQVKTFIVVVLFIDASTAASVVYEVVNLTHLPRETSLSGCGMQESATAAIECVVVHLQCVGLLH